MKLLNAGRRKYFLQQWSVGLNYKRQHKMSSQERVTASVDVRIQVFRTDLRVPGYLLSNRSQRGLQSKPTLLCPALACWDAFISNLKTGWNFSNPVCRCGPCPRWGKQGPSLATSKRSQVSQSRMDAKGGCVSLGAVGIFKLWEAKGQICRRRRLRQR